MSFTAPPFGTRYLFTVLSSDSGGKRVGPSSVTAGDTQTIGRALSKPSARERLARAAFALFDEQGYEQTTVDEIAGRADLGRTTFFRHYKSKEDVIFPDHDRVLDQVAVRLQAQEAADAIAAISDAVRLVFRGYLDEGDLARRRYALTSSVPALREREIISVARYQRLFREFIASRLDDPGEPGQLEAELMAASFVAAHNRVLRHWLRGQSPDPLAELDRALRKITALFGGGDSRAAGRGTTIAVFRSDEDVETLIPTIRRLAQEAALAQPHP
jgi:AcrR family transcriptional regulator